MNHKSRKSIKKRLISLLIFITTINVSFAQGYISETIQKVGNRDLSFLSVNNDGDNTDHYKEFLKGKIDESFSVEDYFSDWCSDSRFSLESVLNL